MPLKTDYKNFIPSTTTKIHDIKQASDGTIITADVILEDVTVYSQEGDSFGSADINATNTQVNANTQSISDIGEILGDVTVEQLAMLASVNGDIQNQLDDKAPLANPTFTGLITTAGQVAFPATQNPSEDPNTLDDYEEGTFIPILNCGTTSPTITSYESQVGKYTKIGNLVLAEFSLRCTLSATGSGQIQIEGLPFIKNGVGGGACFGLTNLVTGGVFSGYMISGGNSLFLGKGGTISTATDLIVGGNLYIQATVVYVTG